MNRLATTNLILNTDSYKASHWMQYPPNTEKTFFYIEAREGGKWDKTVFFGLQMFIEKYLKTPITHTDIDQAERFFSAHGLPFNRAGWEYIVYGHRGYLPLTIRAVPEGTVVPTGNVLVTIENTDKHCHWLPSYIETALLRGVWYPTTVATNSYIAKQHIFAALEKTSDDPHGQVNFKLHDFGARGVSSQESAEIGGLGHLVNFMGSDTVEAIVAADKYYNEPMAAFSIPAAEHSTITSWGKDQEIEAYRNILTQFAKPNALVAVVSDSYDLFNAVDNLWGKKLKQQVIDSGAIIVVRPDSGNPTTIPVEVISRLDQAYGHTINAKGYRVLNNVRVIQGDGMNLTTIPVLLNNVIEAGYSIDNLAMGMGGGLLQQVNRDTVRFAMKCSAIYDGSKWHSVNKSPTTDNTKSSKGGRLDLVYNEVNKQFMTTTNFDVRLRSVLQTIYFNGSQFNTTTLAAIRQRANKSLED